MSLQDRPSPELIDQCVHCGFCLPTCPTYIQWGEEMDSPRGRIYLMKAAVEKRIPVDASYVQHLDACLGCVGCVTACPSGVQYGTLIEQARAQIETRVCPFPRGSAVPGRAAFVPPVSVEDADRALADGTVRRSAQVDRERLDEDTGRQSPERCCRGCAAA